MHLTIYEKYFVCLFFIKCFLAIFDLAASQFVRIRINGSDCQYMYTFIKYVRSCVFIGFSMLFSGVKCFICKIKC